MNKSPSGWHGKLELVYGYTEDETRVSHSLSQAPLKIQRPFYPEGKKVCHSVILHTAGGIVGGDMLSVDIDLKAHSQVLITTAAATKVYGSSGNLATQTINIKIAPQATLEWFPQESIIFKGAIYHQDLRIDLSPGAHFFGWEITRFGRTARGERFDEGQWRSHLEIWQESKPLVIDRQLLQGSDDSCLAPNALAGKAILGSFIYQGDPVSRELIDKIRGVFDPPQPPFIRGENETSQSLITGEKGEFGVSQTLGKGIICRYRGLSSMEVRSKFIEVWGLLRQSQLQRELIKPRVWL